MKRVKIIDKKLMASRLAIKMIDKGFVHKNGRPHQQDLALAMGQRKYQGTLSALLRQEADSVKWEVLTKLSQILGAQEEWLLGGQFRPVQEKKLFTEQLHQPEEKQPEKAENELLKALWGIVRQLQTTNKIEMIKQKAYFIWAKLEQEELIRLGGMSDEDIELHRRLLEIYKEAYQSTKKLEEKRND